MVMHERKCEQSIEHLLKAVKSICTADLIVEKAPVKSHRSQAHVERAVRLVENRYRALLFDVQERTRVEIVTRFLQRQRGR